MSDITNSPLIERLIGLLADTFACYRATHLYHWDVSQPWTGMVGDLIEINRAVVQSVQYAVKAAESADDQLSAHRNNIWRLTALVAE